MFRRLSITYLLLSIYTLAAGDTAGGHDRQPGRRRLRQADDDTEIFETLMPAAGGGLAMRLRRQLAQSLTPLPPLPAEGPAPRPEAAAMTPTPAPPLIQNATDEDTKGLVCCCRMERAMYEMKYEQPSPPGCCCGSKNKCCMRGGLIHIMCGGNFSCGIGLLISALLGVICIAVCVGGTWASRRRRQYGQEDPVAGAAANGSSRGFRPSALMVNIPEDELEALTVGPPSPGECASGPKECPICLEMVDVNEETWTCFPCAHGCCKTCLSDLLHYSSRSVNPTTLALLCPLCRKLTAAPITARAPEPSRAVTNLRGLEIENPASEAVANGDPEQQQGNGGGGGGGRLWRGWWWSQ